MKFKVLFRIWTQLIESNFLNDIDIIASGFFLDKAVILHMFVTKKKLG